MRRFHGRRNGDLDPVVKLSVLMGGTRQRCATLRKNLTHHGENEVEYR